MIRLEPFRPSGFEQLISWIDNRELLMQIAGPYFSFPLTNEQLTKYLADEKSVAFEVIETLSGKTIGHAEIILQDNHICKLDKILIGDKLMRGKGIGQALIQELIPICFREFGAERIELFVYEWNTSAIKTYTKAGFEINYEKELYTEIDGLKWRAFSMYLNKTNGM